MACWGRELKMHPPSPGWVPQPKGWEWEVAVDRWQSQAGGGGVGKSKVLGSWRRCPGQHPRARQRSPGMVRKPRLPGQEFSRERSRWEVKVKRVVSLVTGTFTLCPHLGSNHVLRFASQAGGHQPCVVQDWERGLSLVQMEMSCNYEMHTRFWRQQSPKWNEIVHSLIVVQITCWNDIFWYIGLKYC